MSGSNMARTLEPNFSNREANSQNYYIYLGNSNRKVGKESYYNATDLSNNTLKYKEEKLRRRPMP